MASKTQKIILGILTFVVLTSSVYFLLPDKIRIDVTGTSTTFKVYENNSWVTSGVETINLYNGTSKLLAKSRTVTYETNKDDNSVKAFRDVDYGNGITLKYTIGADGDNKDIELYPMFEKIEVTNGKGLILQYDVSKLLYNGETVTPVSSPQSFGHNMKVEWDSGNYYSKITKTTGKPEGKLTVKYKIDSTSFSKNVRLFDPVIEIIPTENIITYNNYINISFGINKNTEGLYSTRYNFNGTDYVYMNNQLKTYFNSDNRSLLGEYANSTNCLIYDIAMNNNGSCVGGTNISWTATGKHNGAFVFNGGVNWINVGAQNFNSSEAFTLFATINSSYNSSLMGIIESRSSAANFELKWATGNKLGFSIWNSSATGVSISSIKNLSLNTYYDVVAVYSGYPSNTISLYIDGVFDSSYTPSTTAFSGTVNNAANILRIGTDTLNAARFFNGTIDEIKIYNKSLSADEIARLSETHITQINLTYLEYNITQGNLSAYAKNYYLCFTNSTLSENCSSIKSIRSMDNLSANFSSLIGKTRTDFFGVSNHIQFLSGNIINIDTDGDGVTDNISNYTEHRNAFINSNVGGESSTLFLTYVYTNNTSQYDFRLLDSGSALTKISNEIKWLYNFNKTTNLIVIENSMPTYLQNRSSYCNSSNWESCPYSNKTAYQNIIAHAVLNLTNNCAYDNVIFQIGNEPYGANYMNNLSYDNIQKGIQYIQWFNDTSIIIKQTCPSIKVGGAAGFRDAPNLTQTFLSNISTLTYAPDFHSLHPYSYGGSVFGFEQLNDFTNYINNCSTYSVNCSHMIASEWSVGSVLMKNTTTSSTQLGSHISQAYISLLNSFPSYFSMFYFEWSENKKYGIYSLGYPWKWAIFSEKLIDNYFSIEYNNTRDFAFFCQDANIYATTTQDSSLNLTSCIKGNMYAVLITNTENSPKNITLDLNGAYPINNITNYKTGELLILSSGIVEAGVIEGYGNLFLMEDSQTPSLTINSPNYYTYSTNSIWFNITLSEEGSSCQYSLNGASNISMTKQGIVTQFKQLVSGISPNSYNYVDFSCNDTFNNWNYATQYFIINSCPYSGSGDWNVNFNDNCHITSNIDLGGNNLNILGGSFTVDANISNYESIVRNDNQLTINSGGFS